jgi:hypothetical protein
MIKLRYARRLFLYFALIGSASAQAQTDKTGNPFDPVRFLVGDWIGEGSSKAGQGQGAFSIKEDLGGAILVRRDHTDYPAKNGKPAFSLDVMMVIYAEGGQLRATYFDSEKHVIHYTAKSIVSGTVLVQFFERRQTGPIFNFSLCGNHRFPYLWNHGPRPGDTRCVELSFFDFVCQLDSAQCYFRIPEYLEPQHRIIPLLHPPVVLLNHVIQVLAGPDERLSRQYTFGLQFRDRLMGRLAAVECDLLRDLIIADRFPEEAYGSRFIPVLTQQKIYSPTLLIDRAVEIAPFALHFDIGFIDSPG